MSLNYSDRIQNAINFSFFKAQDTDKLLLDAIRPDLRHSVDPKNQKTLPKIYQALFQIFQNVLQKEMIWKMHIRWQ